MEATSYLLFYLILAFVTQTMILSWKKDTGPHSFESSSNVSLAKVSARYHHKSRLVRTDKAYPEKRTESEKRK